MVEQKDLRPLFLISMQGAEQFDLAREGSYLGKGLINQ
jgi:hypothetical protein